MTAAGLAGPGVHATRRLAVADLLLVPAPAREAAAGQLTEQRRYLTWDGGERPAPLRPRGDRRKQRFGVGVLRALEDVSHLALLHDLTGVHDSDPVAYLGHDAQVVRHEQDAQVTVSLDLPQQSENLRLKGHIEG